MPPGDTINQRDILIKMYKKTDITKIETSLYDLKDKSANFLQQTFLLHDKLNTQKAREYLLHGVGRRLRIIDRCCENIATVYPPDRKAKLTRAELADIGINLHAFFINISGYFDNLAWIIVFEKKQEKNIDKKMLAYSLPK